MEGCGHRNIAMQIDNVGIAFIVFWVLCYAFGKIWMDE
jgi:hypothetical protein